MQTIAPMSLSDKVYTVIELIETGKHYTVGRSVSFDLQGDASEYFDECSIRSPALHWTMILGLGPMPDQHFKLANDEEIIKQYWGHSPRRLGDWYFDIGNRRVKISAVDRSQALMLFQEAYPNYTAQQCLVL